MTAPNTAAHSAGAVCCPTEASALRWDRAGWRATWPRDLIAASRGEARVYATERVFTAPDRRCGNCDGRGCMGCVFREHDHDCRNDCPSCCPDDGWTR